MYPCMEPIPVVAMFDVRIIIGTCIGIEDSQNPIPNSYIFLPSCKKWPSFFELCMIDLMEQEGEIVHEDCSSHDNTEESTNNEETDNDNDY